MKLKFVGGVLNGSVFKSTSDVPLKVIGFTDDLSDLRAQGRIVHRAELDNQPCFEGYLSPMWDGDGLRYETQEVYNMLSD